MAQALIRNLDDDVVADYKAAAKANGRAYETELRETLVRYRPKKSLTPAEREAFFRELTKNQNMGTDSVSIIQEARQQRFAE